MTWLVAGFVRWLPAAWIPASDLNGLLQQGKEVSILSRRAALGEDLSGLQELILYGIKGTAAYLDHAQTLGQDDPAVYAKLHEALDKTATHYGIS